MYNQPSLILVKRIKSGEENESVQRYLDQEYIVESMETLEDFKDGTIAVRIKLSFNPIVLGFSE